MHAWLDKKTMMAAEKQRFDFENDCLISCPEINNCSVQPTIHACFAVAFRTQGLCSFCYRRICLKQHLLVTNLTPSHIRKKFSESKGHAPHRSWDFLLMANRVEAFSGDHWSTSSLISTMLETSFAQVTFTTLVGCGISKPRQNCLGHEPTIYFEA